jgi:catechol 2,3-dioxygenase-like lactoylglutathione lyase family enzyme
MGRKLVLDQINMVVRDMEAASAFYTRLGLDLSDRTPEWHKHHRSADMDDKGLDFDLDSVVFARQWNEGWSGRKNGAGCVVIFRTATREEVDEIHAELAGAGYKVQQPPYDAFWGSRFTVIEDPDGNAIGVMSPPPTGRGAAPDPPG